MSYIVNDKILVELIKASIESSTAITPSDTVDLAKPTKGLYVGTGGDVKMKMADGSVVTRTNVASGLTHPWSVLRVYATGTTATGIVGDY